MEILFIAILIVYVLMALYFSFRNDLSMIKFFIIAIFFQNIISIAFSKDVSNSLITVFQLVKEAVLYLSLLINLLRRKKFGISQKELLWIAIYFLILGLGIFRSSVGIYPSIVALRYMLLPVICVAVGRSIKLKEGDLNRLFRFLVGCALILAMFGVFEILILKDSFWTNIGYSYYAVNFKGNLAYTLFRGVTMNFYTWDFFGIPIRRIVSITADPLATAFLIYLGGLIIISGCIKSKTKGNFNQYYLYAIFLTIVSILVLSKAIFVFTAITLFLVAYYKRLFSKTTMRILLIVLITFVGLVFSDLTDRMIGTSSGNHIEGLIQGFSNASLLGNGLGTAGVTVDMLTEVTSNVAESYIGSMVSQIGVIGLIAFALFYLWIFQKIVPKTRHQNSNFYNMTMIIYVGLLVCMIFSESSVSIMGTGIYFILMGIATRDDYQFNRTVIKTL